MKTLLKLEELALFGLSLYLLIGLGYSVWWYALFFLAPDLSMIGYLWNPQIGAWTYNLVHHKGVGAALYVLGALLTIPAMQFAGLIVLGHSSFDRVFGYGLKYPESFHATHLGVIGRERGAVQRP